MKKTSVGIISYYQFYADQYSKQAKTSSPVHALSVLSQNRIELKRYWKRVKNKLEEMLRRSVKEEYLAYPLSVIEYAYIITETADNPLSSLGGVMTKDVKFSNALEQFLREEQFNEYAERITELTHSFFDRLYQLDAIDTVIEAIIDYDYPDNVIDGQAGKQIEEKQKKRDRPLDPTANQEAIVDEVRKLASDEDYQYTDGRPIPTRIRDYIFRYRPSICGELSERQLYTRVIWALQKIMQ